MNSRVQKINGAIRLILTGENADEFQRLREFATALNKGPISDSPDQPIFDALIVIEGIDVDDDGNLTAITIEGQSP